MKSMMLKMLNLFRPCKHDFPVNVVVSGRDPLGQGGKCIYCGKTKPQIYDELSMRMIGRCAAYALYFEGILNEIREDATCECCGTVTKGQMRALKWATENKEKIVDVWIALDDLKTKRTSWFS